jgi:hypothetical protein
MPGIRFEGDGLRMMLEEARDLLRNTELLDPLSRALLESVEHEDPDFNLIGLPHAANLPGVRRKLQDLSQRSAKKREADHGQLDDLLARSGPN